jgi:Amt family ammonium transporter
LSDLPNSLSILWTEEYYWITVVFMFFIHIGFCVYEVSVSRHKNMIHTLMKNTMLIPPVTMAFFFFGWWIYFALPNGPGITGGLLSAPFATPWSELMGTHMGGPPVSSALSADDTLYWARLNGVFWAAFLLFSLTAASIVSGGVIERIRSGTFWIAATLLGSCLWMIDAAWGWHPAGWMVKELGYHDAYASGVIHAISGGFVLGILIVLGPRIGRFRSDGTPRNFNPRSPWLTTVGLFLIDAGFWGFYAACNVPIFDVQVGDKVFYSATNIYLAPTTLSAITFNFITSLCGGLIAGFVISKGDAFWTYSGGLAGIIAASAGNDLYYPTQAFLVGFVSVLIIYKLHYWVERRFKLDDAVGACAVHGYTGFLGVVWAGILLWGSPSSPDPSFANVSPWGNFLGACIMFGFLGLLPGYLFARLMKALKVLRIPAKIELMGLDFSEYHGRYMDQEEVTAAELQWGLEHGLVKEGVGGGGPPGATLLSGGEE